MSTKDRQGTLDGRGSPDPCNPEKIQVSGQHLLDSGDGPIRDPGNGLGWEWGSFPSVQAFYGPGLNFDSSEMIHITPRNTRNNDKLMPNVNIKVHNFKIIPRIIDS